MKNDKRIIDIICDSLLPLAFLFLVVICIILCFTIPVKAALPSNNYPLPYIVTNENIEYYSAFNYLLVRNKNLDLDNLPEGSFGYTFSEGGYNYFVVYIPTTTDYSYEFFLSNQYELFDYSINRAELHLISSYRRLQWRVDKLLSDNWPDWYGSDGIVSDYYINFFAGTSDGYGNFLLPNYSMSNYVYDDDQQKVVFGFGVPLGPDDITNNDTMPDSSDYFEPWSNAPTFDNSTVENALSSIFDLISWLSSNLFNTLESLANFISDSVYFALQKVINNLKTEIVNMTTAIGDKIDEVKVGIGSIVDEITDTFDYIKEPIDKTAVQTELQGTLLYNLSTIGGSIKNTFSDFFDSIPQPDTLSFTVPYTILSKSDYITIDFSWYPPIRNTILPWIVGFLYAGFGLAVFRSIPSIIHGVSGVLQKGG